jgi:predicted nucleic acid-binding protein
MNELNIGEVYYIIARYRGMEQADFFIEMILPGLPIKVLSVNFDLIVRASRLKAHYAMSYMDCFALASAIEEKADIFTGDPEFKHAEKLVKIEWL